MRQIIIDTETTGINKLGLHYEGHRIIEIGAVEIINRHLTGKKFHVYLKPNRLVDPEAFNIHGISDDFLANKPTFHEIADEFLQFINKGELVIHNASFDIGFIDYEFSMLKRNMAKINTFCKVTDSLFLARKLFPGKRNSLDALCSRYMIDNSNRTFHSALLDAEILAKIYLLMTGGQTTMQFILEEEQKQDQLKNKLKTKRLQRSNVPLKIVYADNSEVLSHEQQLIFIKKNNNKCLWLEKK